MKVAIVHDWLVTYAGAERVLEQMLAVYPDADLFSLIDFVPEEERALMRLYPQPRGRQSAVEYFPGRPNSPGLPPGRERPRPRRPARSPSSEK